jgi:hypothetical protein
LSGALALIHNTKGVGIIVDDNFLHLRHNLIVAARSRENLGRFTASSSYDMPSLAVNHLLTEEGMRQMLPNESPLIIRSEAKKSIGQELIKALSHF